MAASFAGLYRSAPEESRIFGERGSPSDKSAGAARAVLTFLLSAVPRSRNACHNHEGSPEGAS